MTKKVAFRYILFLIASAGTVVLSGTVIVAILRDMVAYKDAVGYALILGLITLSLYVLEFLDEGDER